MFYVISNGKCLFNTHRGEVGPRAPPHLPIAVEYFTKGMSGVARRESGDAKERGRGRERDGDCNLCRS